MKRRMTVAQAIVAYLQNQYSGRDGKEHRFIEGFLGFLATGMLREWGKRWSRIPVLNIISAGTNKRWCIRPPHLPKLRFG